MQVQNELGKVEGSKKFVQEWRGKEADDPQTVIGEVLERQRRQSVNTLAVMNEAFEEGRLGESMGGRAFGRKVGSTADGS